MESKIEKWKSSRNVFKLLQHRENNANLGKAVKQYFQFTNSLIKRLGLEAELTGHQGCVNCLQWSADGRHLASGSDDTNVIYWDPFRHRQIQVIPTPHIGNIFSVKFLGSNDTIIATAAADGRVIVQSVDDAVAKNAPLLDCSCHVSRVKRLATSPEQPMLFWSAGEDGLVIQYDMREPHDCPAQSKVFIDLSFTSELKCIAVNPTKPHYIAVGANDCFVRVYDRRKVKTTSVNVHHVFDQRNRMPSDPIDANCVQYYAPGHLARENSKSINFKLATTYIAFNSAGTEMLVNMGCEQIYLFDVNRRRHINELKIPQCLPRRPRSYKACCHGDNETAYYLNVNNNDLSISKDSCACDYIKRANKLLERRWMGDVYAAARDYLTVLQHWPAHLGAYMGLVDCLVILKWKPEASDWLEHFLKRHPECGHWRRVQVLAKEVAALSDTSQEPDVTITTGGGGGGEGPTPPAPNADSITNTKLVGEEEQQLRLDSLDYELRFLGHCNTTTDIKEANFLGEDGDYICAGSDDGIIFIWERKNSEIVKALWGDYSIVNCVQPHPSASLIASSGIDPAVKIWSPSMEDGTTSSRTVCDLTPVVENNQTRLAMDPFETMLANMGFRIREPAPFEGLPIVNLGGY